MIQHLRSWIVVLIALCSSPGSAADAPAFLAKGEVLRGAFDQERHLAGFAAPLRSSGHFVLSPDRGLIWQVETPFPIVTVITPIGLIQRAGGAVIMNMAASRMPMAGPLRTMLTGMLSGEWTKLGDQFAVTRSGTDAGWRVELKPRAGARDMMIDSMTVVGARFAEQVKILRPGGDSESLTFRDQKISAGPLSQDELALLNSAGK